MVTALSEAPVYVATITQAGYRWLRLTNVQVDNNMGIEERSICRGQNPCGILSVDDKSRVFTCHWQFCYLMLKTNVARDVPDISWPEMYVCFSFSWIQIEFMMNGLMMLGKENRNLLNYHISTRSWTIT